MTSTPSNPLARFLAILFLSAVAWPSLAQPTSGAAGGPYVPTPHVIVDRMLALAEVGPDDYLIDLGSGDGRLAIAAVAKRKARGAAGIELDAPLVRLSTDRAKEAGVADRVTFVAGNLFAADVGRATVVTLYLLPHILGDVEAKLQRELAPGTRVVSHDYSLPSWKPVDVVTFENPEKVAISGTARTVLYLYRVPGEPPASAARNANAPEFGQASKDSVWVPTPERMIRRMLQMADTTKDDVVVDLGAGDGRIPIYAAKHFGARAVAVELEANLVQVTREAARRAGVAGRVQVIQQDLFDADLSAATVFALYISPGVMERLKPRFLALRPGTRIASHQFDLGDWEPDERIEVEGRTGYLWVVPAAVEGTWDVAIAGESFRLDLERRYQKISGSSERAGRKAPVIGARLRGTEIRFNAFDRDGTSRSYVGRLEGGRLAGESHDGTRAKPIAWNATRRALVVKRTAE